MLISESVNHTYCSHDIEIALLSVCIKVVGTSSVTKHIYIYMSTYDTI